MARGVEAAVMERPGKIGVKKFPFPLVRSNSAVVRMIGSGLCGTDKHMFHGETVHPGGQESTFPLIPGHENLGHIEELGEREGRWRDSNGTPLAKGDRVVPACDVNCGECYNCRNFYGWCWCENVIGYGTTISCEKAPHLFGGWAEYMYIVPKVHLFKVPTGLPDNVAVLAEPMAVAYGSFARAMAPYWLAKEGVGPGDTVVIQGSGPLGLSHAAMAKMVGAGRVVVIGAPRERLELAKKMGADLTIDISKYDTPKERIAEVRGATEGRGAELVVECVGVPAAIAEGLEMVSMGGTYLTVGNYIDMGTVAINPQRQILSRSLRIIGVNGMPYQAYSRALTLMARDWKRLGLENFVTHTFGIDEAERALETATSLKSLKILVRSD
ncbi:MAG: zinc-binding dehydrogenase [Thaumarchaeota archaeon]|nr:zinc-binding dehydrogenase [Nitrososphaerota archaeon]